MMNLFLCTLVMSLPLVLQARIGYIRIKFTKIEKMNKADSKFFQNLTFIMKPVNRTTTMFGGSGFLPMEIDDMWVSLSL